jgi:diguanylate cyclase (GGDEF)-like protein
LHDTLTGIPNRKLFIDRLQQVLLVASREKGSLSILFIDMDEFKPINDSFGHSAGDLVLNEVAQRIKGCLRESYTVARIGGDEFIVLLPTTKKE